MAILPLITEEEKCLCFDFLEKNAPVYEFHSYSNEVPALVCSGGLIKIIYNAEALPSQIISPELQSLLKYLGTSIPESSLGP